MNTQNNVPEIDYDAAFNEAVGTGADITEPSQEPVVESELNEPVQPEAEGGDTGADAPVVDPVEPGAADVGDGEGEEGAPQAPEPTPAEPVTPVTQEPAPQPPIDPKFLAAAMLEMQQVQQAQQQAQQPPTEPEEPKTYTADDFLDDNQKAALKVFEQEWSEVQAPVTALIQAHVQAALANNKQELLNQVHQSLAPIQQVAAQSQEAMYWANVQAAHPDARERAPEVMAWIEQQPSLVRPHLERVFHRGTAEETIELLDVFKKATGSTGAAPAQPASSAAQVPPQRTVPRPALDATLAPPAAQRSTPTDSRDPNDFDRAFDEAVGGR